MLNKNWEIKIYIYEHNYILYINRYLKSNEQIDLKFKIYLRKLKKSVNT